MKHLLQTLIEAADKARRPWGERIGEDDRVTPPEESVIDADLFIKALEEAMGKEMEVKPGEVIYNPTYDNDIRRQTIDECRGIVQERIYQSNNTESLFRQGYNEACNELLAALSKLKGI